MSDLRGLADGPGYPPDRGLQPSGAPDVTVIVPVYDTMPHLTACLDSLITQSRTGVSVQVVAVDDGSTDASGTELDRYATEHPGLFTVIHQDNSGGPARPCNVGLEHATGRYVFFMGSDDYLADDALERMVAAADRWESDVLCARLVGVNGRWVNQRLFTPGDQPRVEFPSEALASALGNTKLFRRSLLEEHGIRYALDMRVGSDQPFVIDAMRHARTISVLADQPYYYAVRREDAQNITYSSTWRQRLEAVTGIVDHVAALLPAGADRDVILQRHLSGEVATLLRRDFGVAPAAERSALVAGVNALAERYLTDWIRDRLKLLARIRYDLAEAGDLDGLLALHGAEDQPLLLHTDGDVLHQAPAAFADRLFEDRFRLPPESLPSALWGSFGPGRAWFEGSVLVMEGPTGLHPDCSDQVRGWLAPADDRLGWGARQVPRVTKWPPRSSPLDLATPGRYRWQLDLAPLLRATPGSAWAARWEIDAGEVTWRLPLMAELHTGSELPGFHRTAEPGSGQRLLVRALPDPDGRLVFELIHDEKD
ncbi:MAG: glycosyltransferase [Nocardioides sp.]